ncbi:MAG: ComEC/Rec2 family competence protein [Actinobacteria bacterium]|nr:ComEC/Rec2 family competence protein [Actinomycetota bacterium]
MSLQAKSYQSLALAIGIWSGIALADLVELKALLLVPILVLFRNRAVAPVLLASLTGASALLIHLASLESTELSKFVDSHVSIEGVISSDPSKTRPRVIGSRLTESRTTFLMRAETLTTNKFQSRIRLPIRVIVETEELLIPGQRIQLSGRLIDSKERKVAALFIAKEDSLSSISTPKSLKALEEIRIALREATLKIGGDPAALIPGMVIGDTSLQSSALTKRMLEAGLSHLTAVSGANFAIVSAFLFAIIGFFIPNRSIQSSITILALVIFVLLVRPTPSVLRAGVMAAVFLIARLSGRRNAGVNSLAVAITLLLLINPFQAFEAGFILSVLATSGLIFFAPKIAARVPGPKWLGELISIPTAATLFCAPYLMVISGGLNLGTILLNILVAPVVPFVTIFGFVATLLILPFTSLAHILLEIANLGTRWIVYIASWSELMPALVTSAPVIILLGALLVLSRFLGRKVAFISLLIILTVSSSQRLIFPGSDWKVGQCDVGQGDAFLINLGGGSAILFDAGPDPRLLDRCLDQFQVKRLPLVVISHIHADHYQGLTGIGRREVGEVWMNREVDLFESIPEQVARSGQTFKIGDARIEIIWPETGTESFDSITGDGSAENNRSVVALVEIEQVRILVTGDIEPGAQQELLGEIKEIDVIKVPHHGSKHQEPRIFEGASIFFVSVGQNSYGHPDNGLISSLESKGSVFRSDLDGAIALSWHIDSSARPIFSARRLGKEWWRLSWH